MIAGIELGKKYAQISVKTEPMNEPESITMVVGSEQYRIPVEAEFEKKEEMQELFRKLWKMMLPYSDKEPLEYLVFCLEECSEELREMLLEIVKSYEISEKVVRFMNKNECFCAYMFHQGAELLARNALLIENADEKQKYYLLHRQMKNGRNMARVHDVSEKTLEQVFKEHGISSVLLVGDDFEEAWIQQNMRLLKCGGRVFAGKNLFVKGACYRGMELKEETENYLYLDEEKISFDIVLRNENNGKEEFLAVLKGGKNWYETEVSMELLLLDDPELEFVLLPLAGGENQTITVVFKDLPKRPKKTTRIQMQIKFENACSGKLLVRDLGFGELFPASDMNYEEELQWEQ